MASTATDPDRVAPEPYSTKAAAPPPEIRAPQAEKNQFALADVVLRFLVLVSAIVAVVVMATSKQKKFLPVPFPPFKISRSAKFTHSPAFIYFLAANAVAGFYGLITTLLSLFALQKPGSHAKLVSHFVIFDVLLLGIWASAVGSGGAVAYIGLRGNSNVQWDKICNLFDDFCKKIGASLAVSLFGCFMLTLLVLYSVFSLSKRIPRHNH